MKRKVLWIIFCFLVILPLPVFANGSAIKKVNVFECNGKMYGYHKDPIHYHEVELKGNTYYPVGDEVEEPSCALSFIEEKSAKEEVSLVSCVDGDTAKFKTSEGVFTTRFLAIDTPETVHPTKEVEAFGKEASEFTCNMLTNAKKIVLEYDADSEKYDKYGRLLAWVYADGVFLQQSLVEKGYAEVAYLYGDYKYTSLLKDIEALAKTNKMGKWKIDDTTMENAKEKVQNQESKAKVAKKKTSLVDQIMEAMGEFFDKIVSIVSDFFESMI